MNNNLTKVKKKTEDELKIALILSKIGAAVVMEIVCTQA